MTVDESSLSGEPLEVRKDVHPVKLDTDILTKRTCIAFMGTLISRGKGKVSEEG